MKLSRELIEYVKNQDRKIVFWEVEKQIADICNEVKKRSQIGNGSVYAIYFMLALALLLQKEEATSKNLWKVLRKYNHYVDEDMYFYIEAYLKQILEDCSRLGKSVQSLAEDNVVDAMKRLFSKEQLLTAFMYPCSREREHYGHQQEIINALELQSGESIAIWKLFRETRRNRPFVCSDDGLDVFASDILLTYPDIKGIYFNYETMNEEMEDSDRISPELVSALRCMVLEIECSQYSGEEELAQLKPDRFINMNKFYKNVIRQEGENPSSEYSIWENVGGEIWKLIPELKRAVLPCSIIDAPLFVDNKRLHCVIADAIPLSAYNPYPVVAVIDMEPHSDVEFIVVNAMETTRKKVSYQRIIEKEYSMSAGLYTVDENMQRNKVALCGEGGLAKFCRGFVGASTRRHDVQSDVPTMYTAIMLQDRYNSKTYIKEEIVNRRKRVDMLENGDIIVSRLGNPVFYIVDWLDDGEYLIPTLNQFGLKVNDKDKILSEYLCLYLNSTEGQAQLSSLQTTGSSLRSLNEGILSMIKVKLLPMEQQVKLAEEYRKLQQEKRRLLEAEIKFLADAENILKEAE